MNHRYAALDGLRGVAALIVAACHTHIIIDRNIIPHGYLCVDFFFIISGFVMDKAYSAELSNFLSFRKFIQKRAVRLYPMIFLGASFGAIVVLFTAHSSGGHLALGALTALLVLPFPSDGTLGYGLWPLDPPAWSLFWEIAVNILFGLWMFRLPIRALSGLLVLGALALAAAALSFRTLEVGFLDTNAIGGPARVIFGFTAGVLISRLHTNGRLPLWRGSIWWLAAAVFVIMTFPLDQVHGTFDLLSVTIIFPILVIFAINTSVYSNFWNWSGKISYPLYLVHYPILVAVAPLFVGQPEWMHLFGYFGLLAAYLIAAQVALLLFDEPARAHLGRLLDTQHQRKS